MKRNEKEEQIAFLREAFAGVEALVLTSVQGLTVAEVSELRRRLHDAGVNYRVVKNTLAKKATEGTPLAVIADDFKEVTAVAWHKSDPVAPAKVLQNFKKDLEKFKIKAGYNAGQRLDEAAVKALAELPSMDELRASLLGTINGVAAKLLSQLNAPAQHVVGTLQAKIDDDTKKAA
jgi:large subunit ribosomal protein L10